MITPLLYACYPLSYTGLKGTQSLLQHIATISKKNETDPTNTEASAVLSISPGLPPVPNKLVARIQAGEFIDMAEFLPDHIGINTTPSKEDKQAAKHKRRQVTESLEWIQCFSIYVVVLTQKHPDCIQDLLGYQALIVEACMEYNSKVWLRLPLPAECSGNTRNCMGKDQPHFMEQGFHRAGSCSTMPVLLFLDAQVGRV